MEKSVAIKPKDSPAAANSAGKPATNEVSNWVVVTEARLATFTSAETRYWEALSARRLILTPRSNDCNPRPRSTAGLAVVTFATSSMRNDNSWSMATPRKDKSAFRTTARWDAMSNETGEPSAIEIENCKVAVPAESTREVELGTEVSSPEVTKADGL